LPVFNVITPSAHWAAQHSRAKRIGVLGTRATVQSGAYAKALSHAAPGAFVCSQACPLLVPLVEEGWEDDPITNLIVYRYVQPLLMQNIDTLILGCTHYPALRCSIEKVAGRGVDIVESGPAMSEVLLTTITSSQSQTEPRVQFLTTDASAGFMQAAARLLAPHPVARWQAVDTEKP
jgi:glutamate racemase